MSTINKHVTTIHTRCPYAPVWDYYTLTVETPEFLRCEELQEICEEIRGKEAVFDFLRKRIVPPARLTLKGNHGPNGSLEVSG